jgi:predicted ABC-type ATPase
LATTKTSNSPQLRLRIFAGPNGSGKSTIINNIRQETVNGRLIDFGYYINADDIATALRSGTYSFDSFDITVTKPLILGFADASGLLNDKFNRELVKSVIAVRENVLSLKDKNVVEEAAQLVARYLREALLAAGKRFSFETVFSHESNIDIMRRANEAGYKVYLYFVSTESYLINQYRVELRVKQGGHSVPPAKIKSRYFRSLGCLYDAVQEAYQAFVFDNSKDDEPYRLIFHSRFIEKIQVQEDTPPESYSNWFKEYYVAKDKPE